MKHINRLMAHITKVKTKAECALMGHLVLMQAEESTSKFIDNGVIRVQPNVTAHSKCFHCDKDFGALTLVDETDKHKAVAEHAEQITSKHKIKTIYLPHKLADDGTWKPPTEEDIQETVNVRSR